MEAWGGAALDLGLSLELKAAEAEALRGGDKVVGDGLGGRAGLVGRGDR
jgi:hypothetical protein